MNDNVIKDLDGNLSIYHTVLFWTTVIIFSVVSANIHTNGFFGAMDDVCRCAVSGFTYSKNIW